MADAQRIPFRVCSDAHLRAGSLLSAKWAFLLGAVRVGEEEVHSARVGAEVRAIGLLARSQVVGAEHPRRDATDQFDQTGLPLFFQSAVLLQLAPHAAGLLVAARRIRLVFHLLVPQASAPPQNIQVPAFHPPRIQGSDSFHWLRLPPS